MSAVGKVNRVFFRAFVAAGVLTLGVTLLSLLGLLTCAVFGWEGQTDLAKLGYGAVVVSPVVFVYSVAWFWDRYGAGIVAVLNAIPKEDCADECS